MEHLSAAEAQLHPETPEAATPRPEPGPSTTPQAGSSDPNAPQAELRVHPQIEQPPLTLSPESDGHASQMHLRDNLHTDSEQTPVQPPSSRSRDKNTQTPPRQKQGSSVGLPTVAVRGSSELDWMVPTVNYGRHAGLGYGLPPPPPPPPLQNRNEDLQTSSRPTRRCWVLKPFYKCIEVPDWGPTAKKNLPCGRYLTIKQRITPMIEDVIYQREKFARTVYVFYSAKVYKYLINAAIALQVLLGALITALSVTFTTVKQGQISTAILGGLSTIVASFLARVRGSGEPELSIVRKKDLDHLLRDARVFEMDHGHKYSDLETDRILEALRNRLEELLRKPSDGGKMATGTGPSNTTGPYATDQAGGRTQK